MPNNFFTNSLSQDNTWGVAEESCVENVNGDTGFTATVTLLCNWASRQSVIDDLLGNNRTYPRFTTSGARAKTASATPFGGTSQDGSLIVPEKAKIVVAYTRWAEESEENIISESIEPSAEFLTQNHNLFRWGSATGDKLQPEEAPAKLILGFDYVQTRYKLTSIPAVVLTPGMVNSGPIAATLLGLTFAPETLLYVNSLPQRTITSGGTEGWNMTSRFSFRPNTWNKFWRAKTQAWEEMYAYEGSLYKNYPAGDFSTVLV